MKAKRSILAIVLAICTVILLGCGSSDIPMQEDMLQIPKGSAESFQKKSPLQSSHGENTDEALVSFCYNHLFGEWTPLETSENEPTMEIRTCSECGTTESRFVQDPVGETEPEQQPHSELGSAGMIGDKTLVVSIFVNDSTTHWDFDLKADKDMVNTMHRYLGNAVKWIAKQCKKYGVQPEFVYDWKQYPDLYYTYDFGDITLVREDGSGYYTQTDYIDANIDSQALLEKYEAQNIIYIFYFNTGKDNTVNSWALTHTSNVYTEIINVYVRDDYSGGSYVMPASSFAHEILHCFGAYDLYYASGQIPQAYVDHLASTYSKDIMYTVSLGGSITQKFTELDAYYVGLVDSCEDVETWGLAKSSYAPAA